MHTHTQERRLNTDGLGLVLAINPVRDLGFRV
jgi:hypothetical protein